MNKLQYSIIFGEIRPEISERLSLGIIVVDGEKNSVRYSSKKLQVLKSLYPEREYKFIGRVIRSLSKQKAIDSESIVNYLSRYSNNLVSISKLQGIDLEATEKSKKWLFDTYVKVS